VSPTAAGAAAVLFGLDPTADAAAVKAALLDSARPAAAWAGKSKTGGILDLDAAVRLFAQRRDVTLVPDGSRPPGEQPPGQQPPAEQPGPLTLSAALGRTTFPRRGAARLTVTVPRAATLMLALVARRPGRRVAGRCRAPTRASRHRPRCTRPVALGALEALHVAAGTSPARFRPRTARGRPLPAGRYVVTITARDDSGALSAPVRVGFTLTLV
jgi:hypothetical protein